MPTSLHSVSDLLNVLQGNPGDAVSLDATSVHINAHKPSLLLLAQQNGKVIAADDLGTDIAEFLADRLADELAKAIQGKDTCSIEVPTEAGTRVAMAMRLEDGADSQILGCLLEDCEPWEQQLDDAPIVNRLCGALAWATVYDKATISRLETRIRHLLAEHDTLQLSHTEAITAIIEEREERRQTQREKMALEELIRATEAANQAKTQFLANASHELRTPLTAILGYADLLLVTDLSEEQRREHIETIQRNGDMLLELINDILDLSKIEAGKIEITQAKCSPCNIVEDVVSLMQVRAAGKGLNLKVDFHFPLPQTIHTDPIRLRQILINLVGNAIKFTEKGGVRVSVRMTELPDLSPRLQFDISDTGIGIQSRAITTLFDPFTQADVSFTRSFQGTGLGLAISQRLAELLGGEISVKSTVGEGSTFTVLIDPGALTDVPVLHHTPKEPGEHMPSSPSEHVSRLMQGRVLLAEDGKDNQRLISCLLERAGLEVDVVENGRLACKKLLEVADESSYDLVFMDMQMPEMDGYQATAELRKKQWDGPIVALTAHAMVGDREKCLRAGCDDYLVKPIDRNALLATAARYVKRKPR